MHAAKEFSSLKLNWTLILAENNFDCYDCNVHNTKIAYSSEGLVSNSNHVSVNRLKISVYLCNKSSVPSIIVIAILE